MLRNVSIISTVMMVILSAGLTSPISAEPLSPYWRKLMTNDPDTNYILVRYREKSPDVMVEYYKDMVLYSLLINTCRSVRPDQSVWLQYEKSVGYPKFADNQKDDARFKAKLLFQGFDVKEGAQLCAGSMYLFGPKGVLIPRLFKPSGEAPNENFDAMNGYFRIDVKQIEDMGHRSR